jgi:hypothetical protein
LIEILRAKDGTESGTKMIALENSLAYTALNDVLKALRSMVQTG